MSDAINPSHYKRLPAEAIEIIEAAIDKAPSNRDAYLHGQVLEYVLPCWNKNGIEDLRKAKWYLDRLIKSFEANEPEQPAEQPVIKQSLTTEPDPGEGYRLLSKDPPEKLLDTDEGLFACGLDGQQWLSVNYSSGEQLPSVYYRRKIKPAKAPLNSDTIPEGYRKLNDSSEEPRQLGDLRWSVSQKRYVEITVDEIGYANRDNWAACRKVESAIKQSLTPEPPDGWRWIEVGEMLRRSDATFNSNGSLYELNQEKAGRTVTAPNIFIRRNKFEVGEKVVDCRTGAVSTVQHTDKQYPIVFVDGVSKGIESKHFAPYIEETK